MMVLPPPQELPLFLILKAALTLRLLYLDFIAIVENWDSQNVRSIRLACAIHNQVSANSLGGDRINWLPLHVDWLAVMLPTQYMQIQFSQLTSICLLIQGQKVDSLMQLQWSDAHCRVGRFILADIPWDCVNSHKTFSRLNVPPFKIVID